MLSTEWTITESQAVLYMAQMNYCHFVPDHRISASRTQFVFQVQAIKTDHI